ncbi:abortive infection system antitoxin AbiGi family protein [Flavobacterium anhuiense]|uniref:abortive infection system antitoxin AbiGi family protein n=1 Tax=Flavobacterium anhuiense TaxID=459526 RepID=UPI0011827E33|nr:abortive infection system antitoxin AbiGi family protein [Flavobacterium anhuiense]
MAIKKENKTVLNEFNQKKINHIFHYTDNFEVLLKILKNGFAPSYCAEKINDVEYYIPMVSFCNIPLRDVDLYMRYGKYGLGMSLEWALKNAISPVVYIHETTPFKNFHTNLISRHYEKMINHLFNNQTLDNLQDRIDNFDYSEYDNNLKIISEISISAVQFFKNWKTIYRGHEIITYQEREWRFIPKLKEEIKLITSQNSEFNLIKNKKYRSKPHLPDYSIQLSDIKDLRYILINNENQRERVLKILNNRFQEENVLKAILSGTLMIIKEELIHNDF